MHNVIILGAGTPHSGSIPAGLWQDGSGFLVLDWAVKSLGCKLSDIQYVAGYKAQDIKRAYPNLNIVENKTWDKTGGTHSLFQANLDTQKSLVVVYGDIMFRPEIVKKLNNSQNPITVIFDSQSPRVKQDAQQSTKKVKEKIIHNKGEVLQLGTEFDNSSDIGEFIGIVKFSAEVVNKLISLNRIVKENLANSHLADLIEHLRKSGTPVKGIDVKGDWIEVNTPQDVKHFVLGTKSESLLRLHDVLKKSKILDQFSFTVSDWQSNSELVSEQARNYFKTEVGLGKKFIVRSSSYNEDRFDKANAGMYESVLNVDLYHNLDEAVLNVIASYGIESKSDNQIFIQSMLESVVMAGVLFTRTISNAAPYYVINYETTGETDGITSGKSKTGQTLYVARDSKKSGNLQAEIGCLLEAVQEIEYYVASDSLDIEFGIDEQQKVFIFQVRPLISKVSSDNRFDDSVVRKVIQNAKLSFDSAALQSNLITKKGVPVFGMMPDWNPVEMIGVNPSRLAYTLYKYLITDRTWSIQRKEFGYKDLQPHPLMTSFGGFPFIDLKASFRSFVPASLPESLTEKLVECYLAQVIESPELHDKIEFEVAPTCLSPSFKKTRDKLSSIGGVSKSELDSLESGLLDITQNALETIDIHFEKLLLLEEQHKKIDGSKLSEIKKVTALLKISRELGTLPFAHLARHAFVAVTFLRSSLNEGIISKAAYDGFLGTIKTVGFEIQADGERVARDELSWESFVSKYGHLRPGTYDITSPRYDSNPEVFLRPFVKLIYNEDENLKNRISAWEEEKINFFRELRRIGLKFGNSSIETYMKRAIEGREFAKFNFTKTLSSVIEYIADFGAQLELDRAIMQNVSLNTIFDISDQFIEPINLRKHIQDISKHAAASRMVEKTCEVPPLIVSKADFDAFYLQNSMPNFVGHKKVLCPGVQIKKDVKKNLTGKVVLIENADPGYDWILATGLAGLITMFGGANSHMAIRCAESGIPAAIGVGASKFLDLTDANLIELDPDNRVLRRLN